MVPIRHARHVGTRFLQKIAPEDAFESDGVMIDSNLETRSYFHEEEEEEAVTPTPPRRNNKRLVGWIVLIGVVLIVTISLVVGLLGRGGVEKSAMAAQVEQEHEASENLEGPERSNHEIQTHLLGVLLQHTPKETLMNVATPQGQAFSALVEFEQSSSWPTIEIQTIQRYALLTLYYATNGPTEWGLVSWNAMEPKECSWPGVLECKDDGAGGQAVANLFMGELYCGVLDTTAVGVGGGWEDEETCVCVALSPIDSLRSPSFQQLERSHSD